MKTFESIPDLTKLTVGEKKEIRKYLDLPKYYRIDNFLKKVMNNASVLLHTLQNFCDSKNMNLVEYHNDDNNSECIRFEIISNEDGRPLLCLLNYKYNNYYIFISDDYVTLYARFDYIKLFGKAITRHKMEYYSVTLCKDDLCESLTKAFGLMIDDR